MKHKETAILIDAANDVSAFASKDPVRQVITGVYANGKGTEATNGSIAIRVPYVEIDPKEFPHTTKASNDREAVILPIKALKDALSSVPKRTNLPVLRCVRLSTGEAEKAQLLTTDLDSERLLETRTIPGSYPNLDQVWPKGPAALTIAFSAENLKALAEYAIKHGKPDQSGYTHIAFELTDGNHAAVRFSFPLRDSRIAKGLLMPCRTA